MNSFKAGQIVLVKIDFDDNIWVVIMSQVSKCSFSGILFPPISGQQSLFFYDNQIIMEFSDIS
ncbi:hypothetical protein [Enterococcus sp. BWR-S5]|uniref:hypothetical protein n=1 Tax=Enterococcus sp. BWR-S5 TaxID=2787714 RepID=UPI0019222179|nr:hypothetical protein [Enterococcus sp. BWR-S5]MBL1225387.1 hypothetical protein [Enterococcus sp. BWR-S5]